MFRQGHRGLAVYRACVGGNSSSFVTTFCVNKAALNSLTHTSLPTIKAILNIMYHDDLLKSTDTRAEVHTIIKEIIPLLASASFKLTKLSSNERALLEGIPRSDHASDIQELDLMTDDMPMQKAMELQWINTG